MKEKSSYKAILVILSIVIIIVLFSPISITNHIIKTALSKQLTFELFHKQNKELPIIIYDQKVGNLTNEQIDKLWPSNNPRSWILSGTMDGEITKRYKGWHNRYKSQVKGSTDERGLEDDTDLTICIKNLNINSSDFHDIRLIIDYLSSTTANSLIKSYSLEVYAVDTNHNKYGPFNVADFETTGFYMRKTSSTEIYERNFDIVTEKINVPENIKITELQIKPYGNYPRVRNAGNTIIGNWRGADATLFEIAGMKIVGYKHSVYQRPSYIKTKAIDVNKTRENIVKRMYDLATIKWTPSIEFHDTRVIGANPKAIRTTYTPGIMYYGPPYTQRNRVTIEKFISEIHDGILSKPDDTLQICGADCASSVSYSISKYIPLQALYGTVDFIWDRNQTTLLGDLKISGKEANSQSIKEKYTEQEIYEAYAKLQKGDLVSSHHKSGTHVRLITGDTSVTRNLYGKINPEESYFIRTDITETNTSNKVISFNKLINDKDCVVPFKPNVKYTDLKELNEFEGKNSNFYINTKTTFKEAFEGNYIPLTLNAYISATTEEPYARVINANSIENISDGLKGTIYSNYTILNITFKIKNFKTGEHKQLVVYPDHNSGTLEGSYSNIYSLYYNTPNNIQKYIKDLCKKYNNNIGISIHVSSGNNSSMEILSLNPKGK